MFLTIFVKKSFFFMAKKFFDAIFFVEVTKKNEKSLYQMKVGIKIGKVKKFGIGASSTEWQLITLRGGGGGGPCGPPLDISVGGR